MKADLTVEGVERANKASDGRALTLFAQAAATLGAAIAAACIKP